MYQLIRDSRNIININNVNNVNTLYDYMDYGDILNPKIRSSENLTPIEFKLKLDLENLISLVSLKEDTILYRGVNMILTPIIEAIQFNSFTDKFETACNYGQSIMSVKIPTCTNALYISVWEELNPAFKDEEREKEIVLLPGKFIDGWRNGICWEYMFVQDFPEK